MTSSRFALLVGLVVLVTPAIASAQRTAQDIESARQLYNEGMTLRDQGNMGGALEKFRAAHALGNTPLTGIELCRTYATMSKPVEAREVCLGVARIPLMPQETQRSQDARTEAARVAEAQKPKIGSLRVKVTGVPAGAEPLVLIDGASIPVAALGEARAVDPGVHVVTAKIGDGAETRETIETHEGESREIEIAVKAPPVPTSGAGPATPIGPAAPPERKNTLATVSFAIAGVATLVGVVTGLAAITREKDLSEKCTLKLCGEELHDQLSTAETTGDVSTAFFVIGGVALVGGLIATLVAPKGPPTPSAARATPNRTTITPVFGLGGAGLRGAF